MHARKRRTAKRGGGPTRVTLDEAATRAEPVDKEVDSLLTDEAERFLDKPAPAKFEKLSPKEAASSDLIGKVLSHYENQEKLGRGGMGEVKGRISPAWKPYVRFASASALESEPFKEFLREYEAEDRRLREMY